KSTIDDGNRPSTTDPSATAGSGRSAYQSAAGPVCTGWYGSYRSFFSSLWLLLQLMEYSYLLDMADDSEDPYMRLVYASSWAISVYYAYQRTWKPFNPILGETYEMVNHGGITFIAEQVSHHPPMSAAHAENEHFIYDITSKLKTKFLGNSVEVYPVGR
ncbi:hypothetical protein B296_00030559, partial [Ensete ventricosum]